MAKVTQRDRDKTGSKKPGQQGKYPMATEEQCLSAVRLRHNAKGLTAEYVLNKAARAAAEHGWERCKKAILAARAKDRASK